MMPLCAKTRAHAFACAKRNQKFLWAVLAGSLLISQASAQDSAPAQTADAQNSAPAQNSAFKSFSGYKHYPESKADPQTFTTDLLPSWISFDAELRDRMENQSSNGFVSGNDQLYDLTRIRGAITVSPTSWLTGYAQFSDEHALGLPLKYTASNMRDSFDLRQGYLNFHYKPFQLFVGRQLLNFGNERLVGISDWTQTSRSFDGVDLRIGDKNRVDLFTASVVNIYPTAFDRSQGGFHFTGAYGSISTLVPKTTIQPFVFVKTFSNVLSQQALLGSETEVTPGVEVKGKLPKSFDYDVLGALQRGSYSNDSINAFAEYAYVGYTAHYLPWSPRIQAEYDYASGNDHHNPYQIGTFDQLYPSNHNAFGLVDLFGGENIKQARAKLNLKPSNNLTLTFQGENLRLASTMDNVYASSGAVLVKTPNGGFASDSLGNGFDAQAFYLYHKYLNVGVGVGHFFPGSVMSVGNHGAPFTVTWMSFEYKFKVKSAEAPAGASQTN